VLKIIPFDKTCIRKGFNCGKAELDEYLLKYAGQDIRRNLAALFVAADDEDRRIAGYYTLSNAGIVASILPSAFQKELGKYGDVPAIRLGRLAVDRRFQKRGLGERLLANAVIRSVSNSSAWAVMVVDAKDAAAAAFYRKFGFTSLKDDMLHLFAPRTDLYHCLTAGARAGR
jgi:ribosomal protein S18 acetylase RimI-like enzyme